MLHMYLLDTHGSRQLLVALFILVLNAVVFQPFWARIILPSGGRRIATRGKYAQDISAHIDFHHNRHVGEQCTGGPV
jgi:hypothetical protein